MAERPRVLAILATPERATEVAGTYPNAGVAGPGWPGTTPARPWAVVTPAPEQNEQGGA